MPLASKSKLSLLSTATQLLYDDEEMETTTTTTTTTADTITNKPSPPGMGVSEPPDIFLPEENKNKSTAPLPRQRKSSFQDELLSHFERRLSDLGLRNRYPYLQQIDRSQRETGHSLGEGGGERAMSEDLFSRRMGVQGGRRVRGRWWKYSNDLRNTSTFPRRSHAKDTPDGHYEKSNHQHNISVLILQYLLFLLFSMSMNHFISSAHTNYLTLFKIIHS